MCLNDVSRPDPWAAGVNARELMVSLWYPAATPEGRPAPYMTPAESELQLTSRGITCLAREARRRGSGFQEKVAAGRAAARAVPA